MSTPSALPATKSIKTPGIPRHVRYALAARALRDERTVARWLRGEIVPPLAAESIARAASELGIEPCRRGRK